MPKVSVILPVYNVEPYLDEALCSLENQTLKDIEIIAVNDGSTDNSEAILKRYQAKDNRISYYNQTNKGQAAARNLALQHATGEFIYFMDSDDAVLPDLLPLRIDVLTDLFSAPAVLPVQGRPAAVRSLRAPPGL